MKKLILVCALLSGVGAYAYADDRQPPSADVRATQLQKVLQLSDEQTGKIKKVLETDGQQRKALLDRYKPQFEAFHTDMTKQRDQTQAQIKAVLNPKQQQALDAMHEGRGMHGEGMGMGMGVMGFDGMHGEQCPMNEYDDHHRDMHK